jgi:hypothetical protein
MNPADAVLFALIATAVCFGASLVTPFWQAMRALTLRPDVVVVDYDTARPDLGYPIDVPEKGREVREGHFASPPFDAEGIPVVDYRWMRWADMPAGRYHNAITVAQYALWGCFLPWLASGDETARNEFLALADWLVECQGPDGAYRNEFAFAAYGQPPGWLSGMGQGQAASVLVRAYLLTDDRAYLEAARSAIAIMLSPISEGGALARDDSGLWIEEVPEKEPSHILNGMVFALWGLGDYLAVDDDARWRETLQECTDTLRRSIEHYSTDRGVRYELKRPATIDHTGYLPLVIAQTEALARMTGAEEFSRIAEAWTRRLTPRPRRTWLGRAVRALVMATGYRFQGIARMLRLGRP